MSSEHPAIAVRSPTNRSRISNGRALLEGIDGRSALARRYRDVVAAVAQDQGGADLQLIRRFAAVSCLAEQLEARLVSGQAIDINEHSLLASTAVGLVSRLGINRVARNVTPTLEQYMRERTET
jgi:hypothetical protein